MRYAQNETVITAFLMYARVKDIAAAAGISRTSVYRLQQDAEFQQTIAKRRHQLQAGALNQLTERLEKNLNTLQSIADDSELSAQVRINAITALLKQFENMTERHDILDRLATLEAAYHETERNDQRGTR